MRTGYLKRSAKPLKRSLMPRGRGFTAPRKRLNAIGKSRRSVERRQWTAELKKFLEQITWCERCGKTGVHVDVAHRKKRRFILDRAEYFMAVKLCRDCHRNYDEATGEDVHKRMYNGVTRLIESRKS